MKTYLEKNKRFSFSIKNLSESKIQSVDIFKESPNKDLIIKINQPWILFEREEVQQVINDIIKEKPLILDHMILTDYNPFQKYHLKQLEMGFCIQSGDGINEIKHHGNFTLKLEQYQASKVSAHVNLNIENSFSLTLFDIMPEADMVITVVFI